MAISFLKNISFESQEDQRDTSLLTEITVTADTGEGRSQSKQIKNQGHNGNPFLQPQACTLLTSGLLKNFWSKKTSLSAAMLSGGLLSISLVQRTVLCHT